MRHLIVFAALVALIAALYFWAQGGTVAVNGSVLLHDVDGREKGGAGAKAAWQPAAVVEQHLRAWLDAYEDWQRDNELTIRAARNEWSQKVASREEAAGILRVAERANSADLAICQARHREAVADAEDALQNLEKLLAGADDAADPARFLAGLPAPLVEFVADGDGRFSVQAPSGDKGYIVAWLEGAGEREELLLWLRGVEAGGNEQVRFSNANVLTSESLARLAREAKNRGTPAGSPAGSPAN